jgi:hypothetical protein
VKTFESLRTCGKKSQVSDMTRLVGRRKLEAKNPMIEISEKVKHDNLMQCLKVRKSQVIKIRVEKTENPIMIRQNSKL